MFIDQVDFYFYFLNLPHRVHQQWVLQTQTIVIQSYTSYSSWFSRDMHISFMAEKSQKL